jgi:hypothetical protein
MRPTDITRLRRADVFVTPGGGGAAAWMPEWAGAGGLPLFYCYRDGSEWLGSLK